MTLYSPFFLFGFLPASAAAFYVLPIRARTAALCVISLIFYALAAGGQFFVLPLLALIAYALSFICRSGFYICLLLLPLTRLIGICSFGVSFFILRAAAYIYDGHREKNFVKFAAFLFLFPTLGAGPVTRYGDLGRAFEKAADFSLISRGILLLLWGAFKKLFFADTLKGAFDIFYAGGTSLSAVAALVTYSLYIYFDFSGYSDAAIGVCNIFGISLPKNFDHPYMSRSVGEFFRRWHISLGRWLFDCIYLPLGGSRCGRARTILSLGAVWLVSALWHGTSLSYLVWGAWFFGFSVIEKLGLKLGRLCSLCAILFGWVFFFSGTPAEAYGFFARLFALDDILLYSRADIYNCMRYLPFILLAAFFATSLPHDILCALYRRARGLVYASAVPATVLILSCLAAGGHTPFLYASF